jgi:hypothetical protein
MYTDDDTRRHENSTTGTPRGESDDTASRDSNEIGGILDFGLEMNPEWVATVR